MMNIQITDPNGNTYSIEVHPGDQFGNIIGQADLGENAIPQPLLLWVAPRLPSPQSPVTPSTRFRVRTLAGKDFWLHMSPSSTVRSVKDQVQVCEGVPVEQQRLIFNSTEMKDRRCLSECGVVDDSVIYVVYCLRDAFQIYVVPVQGDRMELKVMPTDTVLDVKRMLQDQEGIPVRLQRLLLKGRCLRDQDVLSDYSIVEDTSVNLVLCQPSQMHVFVRLPTGVEARLSVELSETVEEVKTKLVEKEGIDMGSQRLLFKGLLMKNETSLFSLGVKNGEKIRLLPHRSESVRVSVSRFSDKSFDVDVELRDSVDELKAILEDASDIPVNTDRLFVGGRRLQGRCTLQEFGIRGSVKLRIVPQHAPSVEIEVEWATGRKFSLHVDLLNSVLEVKYKIQELECIPSDSQRLRRERRLLKDEEILSDLNVRGNMKMTLWRRLQKDIRVTVVDIVNGREMNFWVGKDNTVADLEEEVILELRDISAYDGITFGGKILKKERTLRECGVIEGSRLEIVYRRVFGGIRASASASSHFADFTFLTMPGLTGHFTRRGATLNFPTGDEAVNRRRIIPTNVFMLCRLEICRSGIFLHLLTPSGITVCKSRISVSATIKEMKMKIAEILEDFPADEQLLVNSGRLLEDDRTLEHYDFLDGAQLLLIQRSCFSASISEEGKAASLQVDLSVSVKAVTRLVQKKFGIPCSRQRFIVPNQRSAQRLRDEAELQERLQASRLAGEIMRMFIR